jgi:Protein-glutamine gamma-glutamyltransferase
MGLRTYYKDNAYNALFNGEDKPWFIAGFYSYDGKPGISRFYRDFDDAKATKTPGAVKMDLIPGDIRAFYNPDTRSANYQFENTICLGNNQYFAFPWGTISLEDLMAKLSEVSSNPKTIRDLGGSRLITPGP